LCQRVVHVDSRMNRETIFGREFADHLAHFPLADDCELHWKNSPWSDSTASFSWPASAARLKFSSDAPSEAMCGRMPCSTANARAATSGRLLIFSPTRQTI